MNSSFNCRSTILVCTYNGEDSLEAAIESALSQDIRDFFEVLIVDDGSTDKTASIADDFASKDERVRLLCLDENQGLPAACNAGIEAARGPFIIRLDDDDLLGRQVLSTMCPCLESGEDDWVFCDRMEVDPKTEVRRRIVAGPFNLFQLVACGVMMRKDLLVEVGGYRPVFWEEYDLYLRYFKAANCPPRYLDIPLYTYFRSPESMTGDPERVTRGWEELEELWGRETLLMHGCSPEVLN